VGGDDGHRDQRRGCETGEGQPLPRRPPAGPREQLLLDACPHDAFEPGVGLGYIRRIDELQRLPEFHPHRGALGALVQVAVDLACHVGTAVAVGVQYQVVV
jgi:hypothetical protein